MHPAITAKQQEILDSCQRFNVKHLGLFGSAATGGYDSERSDFDFLVEFDLSAEMNAFDSYFGLKEALEHLLGGPVDLIMPSALRNPYFRANVERQLDIRWTQQASRA